MGQLIHSAALRLLLRPVILLLGPFAAGIIVSHKFFSCSQALILPLFICISILLISILFSPPKLRIAFLLVVFFLIGMLLDLKQHNALQLPAFALKREKIIVEGTILEPAEFNDKTARVKINVHQVIMEGQSRFMDELIVVSIYDNVPNLIVGEKIRFPARLKTFRNFNNPGRYDYESAMGLKGFSCSAAVSDGRYIVPMGRGHLPLHRAFLEKIQKPIRDFFNKNLSIEDSALFRALILGERQGIHHELREPFNRTGLGHVLAVSGLHIGLVAWVAFVFFKWCLTRSYSLPLKINIVKAGACLTCLPVFGYIFIAGFQVSSQRAMIMILVFLLSLILGREKEIWSTFALAGILILTVDPHAVFSMSFQLSFSAVVGILWLTPVILDKIPGAHRDGQKTILRRFCAYFIGLAAVCIAATVFLLPIVLIFFHRISLVSIPANLMVVPVLGLWVIPLGLLSVLALPVCSGAADWFLQMSGWGLHVMVEVIRYWSDIPWAGFWMVTPNLFEMLLYYAFLFFIFYYKSGSWAKIGIVVVSALLLIDTGCWIKKVQFNKALQVTFIDVGQANAALVEFPGGKKMMIDGGGFSRGQFDVGKMVVAPFLWHAKIPKIDYLVLSHPQSDHMNGLRFIAQEFGPKEFWFNGDSVETASFQELMSILDKQNIRKLLPVDLAEGRNINGVTVEVLHPRPGNQASNRFKMEKWLNNNSLVLKITYGGRAFLFAGDLEQAGEAVLLANAGHRLKSDVLLSPHHGSKHSSTRAFLDRVQPKICVVSSGAGNYFGFPHEETRERLQDIGCRIIRIDQQGAVKFIVGPELFEVSTFLPFNRF